ncbi:MAG: carbamate kinase [Candidatus Aenigmarchaeota archaeon]|nr:carbamate kinase [Candidatus Aenigmarchaeota archaeon]
MGKTLLVALGGNALLKPGQKGTAAQHVQNVDRVAEHLANLHNRGFRLVLTHGNGPQVGNILLQQEKARDYAPPLPLHVCVAQSQGMIGSFLQEALYNKLHARGFRVPVVTVVTQVLVDRDDPAFSHPTKPVGPYYPTRDRMDPRWKVIRTVKGFRRVVPSPRPKEIVEAAEIRKISRQAIVIAAGGGGVPVVRERGLRGVDAVIDKDLTAAKLAEAVQADILAILTDVDYVYLHYKQPNQKHLEKVTLDELQKYQAAGHFPPGSMGPKVQAAIRFLQRGGGKVIITSLDRLEDAIDGEWGTVVTKNK